MPDPAAALPEPSVGELLFSFGLYLLVFLVQLFFIGRAIVRRHRSPASRAAWVIVIAALPGIGILAYLFLGEVNVGRKRTQRLADIIAGMPPFPDPAPGQNEHVLPAIPARHAHLFDVGRSISGFEPYGGHRIELFDDADRAIEQLVADMDAAREHVHLLFYIWLDDGNGRRVAAAAARAAERGVQVRALVDAIGSRGFLRSATWRSMLDAGVQGKAALAVGNPLTKPFRGRIDLRNHRKIAVIDSDLTFVGSQNCADAAFSPKPKFAPWVDVLLRIEGPSARANQFLFVEDWQLESPERLSTHAARPLRAPGPGAVVQVVATGPTIRPSAMSEMFQTLIHAARGELVITTPYFVPDEGMLDALCAAGRRGVDVTMILPENNDSRQVAAASRSYYGDMLEAGLKIFEFRDGLLHSKSVVLDREVTLVGSANMDRRSVELNFENNVLIYDPDVARRVRALQDRYIMRSRPVTLGMVQAWPVRRRLWNNTVAMLGPVL